MLFPLATFAFAFIIALAFFTIVYLIAMHRNDNSIVDLAWSPAFILLALWSFLAYGFPTKLQILATLLVVVWGARLYLHLYLRKRNTVEDFRYAAWRKRWGRKRFAWRSYLHIYVFQAFLITILSLPVLIINLNPSARLGWLAFVGTLLWVEGFFWEAIGDWQLGQFKANPRNKGKILTTGVWRYTRHPNYFGDTLQWWGIGILALEMPGGWIALISPLILTYLLMRVSGVPLLESKWATNKEYQAYAKRTPAFFPRMPKPTTTRRRKA